jgi:hypothetical protein
VLRRRDEDEKQKWEEQEQREDSSGVYEWGLLGISGGEQHVESSAVWIFKYYGGDTKDSVR